jgi:hypothetical protein
MHYFGLENRLLRKKTIDRVYDFLKNNSQRLIYDDDLIIDFISLSKNISLNCSKCPKKYGCCNGSPHKVTDKFKIKINSEYKKILIHSEKFWSLDVLNVLKKYKNIFDKNNIIEINDSGKHCLMMQDIGSKRVCILQLYALENNLHPLEFKPISCSLFPLDIIILDNRKKFIFSKTIDDSDPINKISRFWESVKYEPCMNLKKDDFKISIPIYRAFENEIKYYFGDKTYERIYKIFQ